MPYAVLNNRKKWLKGTYSLVSLRKEDIFLIKEWRNEQIDILRQKKPLSDEDQQRYYQEVIEPLFDRIKPEQILFSFLEDTTCIGYGGLVHIDWSLKKAEVSFLVQTQRTHSQRIYEKDFSTFLILIKGIAFQELEMETLYTETYDIRPLHVAILEKNGFALERRIKNALEIQGKPVDSLLHVCTREP